VIVISTKRRQARVEKSLASGRRDLAGKRFLDFAAAPLRSK
jgi:hypothetical protein